MQNPPARRTVRPGTVVDEGETVDDEVPVDVDESGEDADQIRQQDPPPTTMTTPSPAEPQYDEDNVLIRDHTTVDADSARLGITLGDTNPNWRGEYEEIPPPTYEELQKMNLQRLQREHDRAEALGLGQRVATEGHDYDASDEYEVSHLGILAPQYD